ncbi:MAG: hypothetical protein M1544_00685 [Candidatus Marsarchaeota archaeon]|nr:hypothetical protein [Candidatus Marsarchaeota archaeon]
MIAGISSASFVGSASIHAPAVILQTNNGTLTTIKLDVTTGNGAINITGPASVAESTLNSSEAAAQVASSYLGLNYKDYNFHYEIFDGGANVSGPSAGTAMTLLALSSLSHKPLLSNFTVTGVINYNGTIGEIGGVYDKIGAAKSHNISFIMVPYAGNGSLETEIYYLASKYYGIPVIPIMNISEAFSYATGVKPIFGMNVSFNVSDGLNVSGVPQANLSCSNQCNQTILAELAGFTLNFTNASIRNVSAFPGFAAMAANLNLNSKAASELLQKGYYYSSADVAFLDFINSFMFQNPNLSISGGLNLLDSVSYYCSSLTPPPLTRSNYDNVLNAELRQLWGNTTITALISNYNSTAIDSDGVLRNVYSAAEAYAWCRAAGQIYSLSEPSSPADYVNVSPAISTVAKSQVSSALSAASASVPSIYTITASEALNSGDYALALLDSDYIMADEHQSPASTALIYNETASMVNGSRYGSWATQFADEGLFYLNESKIEPQNANRMASDGFYAVLLGNYISNSTREINSMLTPTPVQKAVTSTPSGSNLSATTINIIIAMLIIIIALLVATLAVMFIIMQNIRDELDDLSNGRKRR